MANDDAVSPVIYLFHEGKTELGYLQALAKNRDIRIVQKPSVSSPCIEIWGVLCTEDGSKMDNFPLDRHELHGLLHKLMPKYDHRSGAQFDVGKMTQTEVAIRRAKAWAATHGQFPECLNASHYAGIYPLVEKIIKAPFVETKSWRRR